MSGLNLLHFFSAAARFGGWGPWPVCLMWCWHNTWYGVLCGVDITHGNTVFCRSSLWHILPEFLQIFMQHLIILDGVITALDCSLSARMTYNLAKSVLRYHWRAWNYEIILKWNGKIKNSSDHHQASVGDHHYNLPEASALVIMLNWKLYCRKLLVNAITSFWKCGRLCHLQR